MIPVPSRGKNRKKSTRKKPVALNTGDANEAKEKYRKALAFLKDFKSVKVWISKEANPLGKMVPSDPILTIPPLDTENIMVSMAIGLGCLNID